MSNKSCSGFDKKQQIVVHVKFIRRKLKTLPYRYLIRISKKQPVMKKKTKTRCSRMQKDAFRGMRLNQTVL